MKKKKWYDSDKSKMLGSRFIYSGCPSVKLHISGNCPVQAYGFIDNDEFYFRARWDDWSFEVYDGRDEHICIYCASEVYSNASWIPVNDALKIIGEQCQEYWTKVGAFRVIKERFGEKILKRFQGTIKNEKAKA